MLLVSGLLPVVKANFLETRKRVIAVALFWILVSCVGPRRGPPGFTQVNKWISRKVSPWQLSIVTLVTYYVLRNIDALLNLQPRPTNQSLYSPSFGRAVSIVTAGNAGAWTALPLRPKFIRDIFQLVFGVYYMFTPDHAEEKSRKFNCNISANHLRAAFEIMKNPYMSFLGRLMRPKLPTIKYFEIPRPKSSIYVRPVKASLWYDKPIWELQNETKMILHIHGGGFITSTAELHADSLTAWARQTKVPIIAIDYRLAPEYPFPYALDECFESYLSIMDSLGLCVGLSGTTEPDVVITGDSAGGNIAAATVVKIIMTNNQRAADGLPLLAKPVSLVLTYPALDLGPAGIYGKLEMDLIRQQAQDDNNNTVLEKKEKIVQTYYGGLKNVPLRALIKAGAQREVDHDANPLTLSSRVLFFSDGILSAPALYCMLLLYLGTDKGSTDFKNDPLMSPLWADDAILAEFPKVYISCGDIDPLVDDSAMFVSRLRNARRKHNTPPASTTASSGESTPMNGGGSLPTSLPNLSNSTLDAGLSSSPSHTAVAELKLLTAISHGFLQFEAVFPEAKQIYEDIGNWFIESFENAPKNRFVGAVVDEEKLKRYKDPFNHCHVCD